ncbi:MAG: heavy metal sensor histidine kinase [Steroidobacteraceae bacterium]
MSWKRARNAPERSRRAAMATWLTVYYAIAALALLAAASGVFYFGLQHSLDDAGWVALEEKVNVVTRLLERTPGGGTGIAPKVAEEAEISGNFHSRFLLRVLDAHRRVLVETAGMGAILPDEVFPWVAAGESESRGQTERDHRRFLLVSAAIPGALEPTSPWRLQAALDMSAAQHVLQGYLRRMLFVLAGGVLLAAAIGVWIARRGLRPIAAITRATERIGAERLHERIGPAGWPAELTALAAAFDGMLERLQQSFERLTQFSADLAHELRTPINNLMGEAQVALAHERSAPEYREVLHSALEEYARLARMIDRMLFLAYAEHTRRSPERAALDAAHEMQAVEDFYQVLAEESGVELTCAAGGQVFADPHLLRRALSNLVSNALKHTPRGGRVRIEGERAPDGGFNLRVSDTGMGIAPEHLPRLADRFYRVDPARTAGPGGSGLGLAIVKSIMDLHGGTLSIESVVGRGTTANLYFPRDS